MTCRGRILQVQFTPVPTRGTTKVHNCLRVGGMFEKLRANTVMYCTGKTLLTLGGRRILTRRTDQYRPVYLCTREGRNVHKST